MLRLKEVASQVETFSKRVWQKQKPQEMRIVLIGPLRAKASKCFLLTGRLYWLLGAWHRSKTGGLHYPGSHSM